MTRRYIIGGTDCTDVIRQLVDAAPPLSPEQRDKLRMLFEDTVPVDELARKA